MQFRVLGMRDTGALETLLLDASDARAARASGLRRGIAVIDVAPVGRGAARRSSAGRGDTRLDLLLFCQELRALLSAGISLGEALETLSRKGGNGGGTRAAADLLAAIREGKPLSAAMALQPDTYPRLLVESMRASERTSDYVPALTRYVRFQQLGSELRSKAWSAALYPLILLAVSGCVLLFLLGYVVPRFAQVYAEMGDRLPFASRVLLSLGQGIGTHPVLMAVLAAAGAAAFIALLRSAAARQRAVAGLYRVPRLRAILETSEYARMYRTLALLVHGGIALVPAMDIVRGLLSPALVARLDAARRHVSEGQTFSSAMQSQGLATVIADRFMRVGEQTGRLGEMLDRAADFHEEELGRMADRIGRVLGPVMMLFMGLIIGFVVVMMYLPIFQLADAIQ